MIPLRELLQRGVIMIVQTVQECMKRAMLPGKDFITGKQGEKSEHFAVPG